VVVGFNILGCLIPAYLSVFSLFQCLRSANTPLKYCLNLVSATFGPKLGLRQMCQARYSFGFYGVTIPAFLNGLTIFGFSVLNCILGGETLSSASIEIAEDGTPARGGMSRNVGIVVVSIVSLFVSILLLVHLCQNKIRKTSFQCFMSQISFCGWRVLNL
jgi:purine-cytosine permease-like protein